MTTERSLVIRLRRTAARRGLTLTKSRKRDPLALGYGHWWLYQAADGETVLGGSRREGASLDEVEQYLNGGQQ